MSLVLTNIAKAYPSPEGTLNTLDTIDLTIDTGSFVSIIGPSGCGKSTLCNLIAGLEAPDQGTVTLNGQVINNQNGHVGYMMQKDLLLPWRTLLENATLGMDIKKRDKKSSRREAFQWLTEFGLADFAHHFPDQLSGGMRQRGALLRTLLYGEKTLLLDEPFGALDALTRREMQLWLLSLWQKLQHTIVLITHDVEEALLLSDQIVVLSARPAKVLATLEVPFPRPREQDLLFTPETAELKKSLMGLLSQRASLSFSLW